MIAQTALRPKQVMANSSASAPTLGSSGASRTTGTLAATPRSHPRADSNRPSPRRVMRRSGGRSACGRRDTHDRHAQHGSRRRPRSLRGRRAGRSSPGRAMAFTVSVRPSETEPYGTPGAVAGRAREPIGDRPRVPDLEATWSEVVRRNRRTVGPAHLQDDASGTPQGDRRQRDDVETASRPPSRPRRSTLAPACAARRGRRIPASSSRAQASVRIGHSSVGRGVGSQTMRGACSKVGDDRQAEDNAVRTVPRSSRRSMRVFDKHREGRGLGRGGRRRVRDTPWCHSPYRSRRHRPPLSPRSQPAPPLRRQLDRWRGTDAYAIDAKRARAWRPPAIHSAGEEQSEDVPTTAERGRPRSRSGRHAPSRVGLQ